VDPTAIEHPTLCSRDRDIVQTSVWGTEQFVMVDGEEVAVSVTPSIIKGLTKPSETECQSCAELKLQLKTAVEIMEMLEEE
jgi:hypothetical protein